MTRREIANKLPHQTWINSFIYILHHSLITVMSSLWSMSNSRPFLITCIFYIVLYSEPFHFVLKPFAFTVSTVKTINMFLWYFALYVLPFVLYSISYSEPLLISSSILFPSLNPFFWYSNLLPSPSSLLYKVQVPQILFTYHTCSTFCPHSHYYPIKYIITHSVPFLLVLISSTFISFQFSQASAERHLRRSVQSRRDERVQCRIDSHESTQFTTHR